MYIPKDDVYYFPKCRCISEKKYIDENILYSILDYIPSGDIVIYYICG